MKKFGFGRALFGVLALVAVMALAVPMASVWAEDAPADAAAAPAAASAPAADAATGKTESKSAETSKVPEGPVALILNSGAIGIFICFLSIVVVGLAIENLMSIRRNKMMPEDLLGEIENALDEGDYEGALNICQNEDCMMTRIIGAGLGKMAHGFDRMADAMAEEADSQATLLHQKLGWINLIAATAPSLGLLGTVQGMVAAFGTIAKNPQSNASDLAAGIYVALMTTMEGLVVAIPATVMFTFFRGRVVKILMVMGLINSEILDRFRPVEEAAE